VVGDSREKSRVPHMPRKGSRTKRSDLWIAAQHSFKPVVERGWDHSVIKPSNSTSRLLDLADVALGCKDIDRKKKPRLVTRDSFKTHPDTHE
jgi:hypothetical protein